MAGRNVIDRAVILARGLGTRMRSDQENTRLEPSQSATADTGVKAMIPFGRPFLDFVLSGLADAGFQSVCIVIGPEHFFVQEYYRRIHPQRFSIRFAIQSKPLGTANAVLSAEEFAGSQEFVVLNSDNLYPPEVLGALRDLGQPGAVMFEEEALLRNSNIPAERIKSFAYARLDQDGFLADLVEKPGERCASDLGAISLVSMNAWRFSQEIFAACRQVSLSPRGEYELPEAVGEAVRGGMRLKIRRSTAGVLDLSRRFDIPAVAERLKDLPVRL